MKLILTISDPGQAKARMVSRSLEKGSLTIGRAAPSDWVIDDPERVLSKQHCRIDAKSGRFILTDTSTNGVYVNGASQPVGEDKTSMLSDGDRLQLGGVVLSVAIDMDSGASRGAPLLPDDISFVDMLGKAYTRDPGPIDEPGSALPNAVLDDWASPSAPSIADRVPIQNQAFKPPPVLQASPKSASAGGIPDDWHMDGPAKPALKPLNGDHAADRIGAPMAEARSGSEREFRALVAGLASLSAGNAALRAALGCSVDFASPGSLLTTADAKTLQAALASGDGTAVTDVLAGGLAHQTALLTGLRTALDKLSGSAAIDFKSTLAATYRQVFEAETRNIAARKK